LPCTGLSLFSSKSYTPQHAIVDSRPVSRSPIVNSFHLLKCSRLRNMLPLSAKWIQHTEAAIREGRHFKTTEAKKHTFGQLIDRYIKDELPTKKNCEQRQGAQFIWWKKQLSSYLLLVLRQPKKKCAKKQPSQSTGFIRGKQFSVFFNRMKSAL